MSGHHHDGDVKSNVTTMRMRSNQNNGVAFEKNNQVGEEKKDSGAIPQKLTTIGEFTQSDWKIERDQGGE